MPTTRDGSNMPGSGAFVTAWTPLLLAPARDDLHALMSSTDQPTTNSAGHHPILLHKPTHDLAEQQHRVGPVLVGLFDTQGYGKFKYEFGYLFGLTRATENGAVRWKLEYEFRF